MPSLAPSWSHLNGILHLSARPSPTPTFEIAREGSRIDVLKKPSRRPTRASSLAFVFTSDLTKDNKKKADQLPLTGLLLTQQPHAPQAKVATNYEVLLNATTTSACTQAFITPG